MATKELTRVEFLPVYQELIAGLEAGQVRVAEKRGDDWVVNSWIKEMILLGFKYGELERLAGNYGTYFDKDTLAVRQFSLADLVRLVPGGSSVRRGAYLAKGTIVMPPAYINIGVYIDEGCMIDSHALVGSGAQLGKNVHLSAASQVGGVLEPVGASPVIIEDGVFVGGNCGVYESVIIKTGAVLGSGVILNNSTKVFDSTKGNFIEKNKDQPLIIPENAVVVAGTRQLGGQSAKEYGIGIYCPVIIKYRDDKTDQATLLEQDLR